jgi:hypothetical protein
MKKPKANRRIGQRGGRAVRSCPRVNGMRDPHGLMSKHSSYDRREHLRRSAAGALGLGTAAAWPLAPARASADPGLAALARELDGDLIVRGGPGYAQARLLWNPRFGGIRPIAVAYAATIADIRRVIRWASRYDVQLATRSGGHSFAGFSCWVARSFPRWGRSRHASRRAMSKRVLAAAAAFAVVVVLVAPVDAISGANTNVGGSAGSPGGQRARIGEYRP